jgi:flagellar basal body P-ring formation protein FlgA
MKREMTMIRRAALALALTGASAAYAGPPYQDTSALDRAVASFTGRAIGEDGGAAAVVDPRLRLAQCTTLALSWHGANHDAVVVNCTGPEWHVYVPVVSLTAPAAAMPMRAAPAAPAPVVIKRGDPVMIEAGADGFSITREGTAMGDAAAGARLMVKVDDSRVPVQAVAMEGGRATLPGWN